VKGEEQLIPVKETHEHLGTKALLQALQRFRDALHRRASTAPDITTRADVQAHVGRLEVKLIDLLQQQDQQDAQLPVNSAEVPCPYCDAVFDTENAMRIHAQLAHKDLPPRVASTPTQFVPRLHACGGLPPCRLFLRTFYRWQYLKEHIESGACDKLGGESLTKHPVKADSQAIAVQPSRDDNPPDTATGVSQNVPLCERLHFARQRHDWEALLRDPFMSLRLRAYMTKPLLSALALSNILFGTISALGASARMTDPSQGLNPEADIFAFCNPTLLQSKPARSSPPQPRDKEIEESLEGSTESTQPPKRPRPEPNLLMASRQQSAFNPRRQQRPPKNNGLSAEARLMARMLLYHEDQLAAQRMDKDFVLFMRQDYASIIPNLHAISVEWHAKKEEGAEGLTSSLRTLLLACLVKELLARVQKLASTQEGQEKLQRTKWMDQDQQWTFLRWCHKTRKLVVDDNKPSLSHTELVRQLTFLLENLRGDIIHKFHSTKGLDKVEENASNLPSVTFLLGISLRGERAHEIHEVLCKLLGSSAWQLVGVSMKREGLQRAPAAKQLAKMLFGKSFLGTWQGRRLVDNAEMQRTVHNPTSLCIGLGAPPRHNPDVQTLIDHWYAQDFRQALMQLSPWLFLQLPRFRHQADRIVKAKQCHYYVVTPGQRGYLALDDDKKYMDLHGEEWIASQIYLLEVQLRQMCQDMGILQQRHNNLHYQISLLMRNQRHLAQQLMSKSSPNKYRPTPQLIDLHELDD
ncbi:unnamed protein product, partial [Symbiodinium necroappetens]